MVKDASVAPVIVADIGGTNTRVALADGAQLRPQSVRRFANSEFAHLRDILGLYRAEQRLDRLGGICIAAAGPVRGGVATMTNLDWRISREDLVAASGAQHVAILNDLQAQGHALGRIPGEHLKRIVPGRPEAHATRLVVGLGTGMNAAPVHEVAGGGRLVAPSECGHSGMPVVDEETYRLSEFVAHRGQGAHGFAGIEDVLAGRGIPRLYDFVTGTSAEKSPAEVMALLAAGDGKAREVAALYTRILGHVLGDLALVHLPFGGISLIGGVARAMLPYLVEMDLALHMRAKGRFADFMEGFEVTVVEDDFAALIGCAAHLAHQG